MLFQKSVTLRQGHGVRVNLGNVVPVVIGQAYYAVAYAQFVFAHYRKAAVAQQFVVVENAAGYGVFDCHEGEQRAVAFHLVEKRLERVAANQFNVFAFEIIVCGYVVERAFYTLYRYFFHILFIVFPYKKSRSCEAGFLYFLFCFLLLYLHERPLRFIRQSKNKSKS